MAIPVARVHLAMAHAALPGLLPTPPKCMLHPAAGILPSPAKSPANKPSRADSDERWNAHKIISPASPSSSSSSGQRSSPDSKSGCPGRASSCERWDSNKKCMGSKSSPSITTSSLQRVESGGGASRTPSSGKKCDSNSKRRPASRSPSAERWDLHKKPRSLQAHGDGDVGSDGRETMDKVIPQAIYAGPGYVNSPEPCTLPIPTFMVRAR